MSAQDNKALVRRFIEEVVNKGNLSVVDELVAPNFVDHSAPPGQPPGPQGVKQAIQMYHGAFPDIQMTAEDIIAEGDKVASRVIFTGTHKGELMGIAATGKQVTVNFIEIIRWQDGKAVERWAVTDMLGLMQQLGAVPPPGQH